MAYTLHRIVALGLLAGLAACSNNNPTPAPPPVVVPPAAKLEDQFGANFGIAYRADPLSEAKDPAPGDIIPLSLTAEPVPL